MNFNNKGISVIEALISSFIIVVVFSSIIVLVTFSFKSDDLVVQTLKARNMAQETLEAARNFRDGTNWNDDDPLNKYDGFGVVATGTPFYLSKSGDNPPRWFLENGVEILGSFRRQIVFYSVGRNLSGDIVESGGVNDLATRKVVVTVSWQEKDQTKQIELISYFTDWQ